MGFLIGAFLKEIVQYVEAEVGLVLKKTTCRPA